METTIAADPSARQQFASAKVPPYKSEQLPPRRASIISAIILVSLLVSSAANAVEIQERIAIRKEEYNYAIERCAQALVNKAGMISSMAPRGLKIGTYKEADEENTANSKKSLKARPYIHVSEQSNRSDLVSVPFLFRDAEHVLAFMQSSIYEEIRDNPTLTFGSPRLAIAYGGFYQIFSKDIAVTEPKHFYHRFIGGRVRASQVYMAFDALINPYSGLVDYYTRSIEAYAADAMGEGDKWTHMVEAHLASAVENGFEGKGDYVNLISSSILAVEINISNWDDVRFSAEEMKALRSWANAAAAECNEANYKKELESLEKLKADGYEIVPFNRKAMMELSWRLTLEEPHPHWTIEQFDRIVKLGDFPHGGVLPSMMLTRMTPQKRKEALEHNNVAKYRLNEWKENKEKYNR